MYFKRLTLLSLVAASSLYATNGFVVTYQGAKASAMADAFVAQADDPSANYYNPAGITQLSGTQFSTGLIMAYQTAWKFRGDRVGSTNGSFSEDARTQVLVAPHIYLTQQINDNWYFGFAVNASYPLSVQWHTTDALSNIIYENNMLPITINPNIAYKFDDIGLSIAAGVNYTYAFASTEFTSNSSFGTHTRAELEGGGWGYNLGLKWDITEYLSLGATYRSKVKLDLSGDVYLQGVGKMHMSSKPNLPAAYVVGLAYKPTDRWTIETDVVRTEFSSYKNFANQAWDDTWGVRFGVQYALNNNFDLRFGYAYEETPVPDEVVGPDLPDGDNQTIAMGFGYHKDGFKIDMSIGDMHRNKRSVDNAYQRGNYELDVPFVQMTFAWKF
ncbi:MAG: outer membrane protein transport protein [Campylobacter sp.]|nr:outer membrane protein transport protein [Campylobacter sp.]